MTPTGSRVVHARCEARLQPRMRRMRARFDGVGTGLDTVAVLHRDDPLRRAYLKSRWQSQPVASAPLSRSR
jgi:hypothetical protein